MESLEPCLSRRNEERDIEKGRVTGPRVTQGRTRRSPLCPQQLVASLFCLAFLAARVAGVRWAEDTQPGGPLGASGRSAPGCADRASSSGCCAALLTLRETPVRPLGLSLNQPRGCWCGQYLLFVCAPGKHFPREGKSGIRAGGNPLETPASRARAWALDANAFYRSNHLGTTQLFVCCQVSWSPAGFLAGGSGRQRGRAGFGGLSKVIQPDRDRVQVRPHCAESAGRHGAFLASHPRPSGP